MNITVDREAFARTLARAQGVVDKRHALAMLTNILLEASEKAINVIATDLEVSLQQTLDAKVSKTGRAATSARTLFEIIRESPTEQVTLKTLDNQWLEVVYGKSRFKLMGVDPDDHPGMPQVGGNGAKAGSLEIESGDLTEMIRKTVFAVSADDTRSNLSGVFLTKGSKKGVLRMVATDGHRLALIDRPVAGSGFPDGSILPRKGLTELGKLLGESTDKIKLSVAGSECVAQLGDSTLSMRLVEGKFPDYQKVIPEEPARVVRMERDTLLQTLRRVSIMASERARSVRLSLEKGRLEISASNPDMGEAREEVVVEYAGEKLEVGFNAKYLIDVLAVLPEGSDVELGLTDELSPGVVRGGDSGYTYVVMPLRI
jgi:DNA polymerase-3 subunit beta